MKVLVVGGGLAGLTLASFLEGQEEMEVDVIEKDETWEPRGYTLGVWDNGRQILKRLGAAEEFDRHSAPIEKYELLTAKGKELKQYNFEGSYGDKEPVFSHIDRGKLHDILLKRLDTEVKMGTTVEELNQDTSSADVRFSDGREEEYDLVVGADGIKSQIRSAVLDEGLPEYIGVRAWFSWVPDRFGRENTFREFIGREANCRVVNNGDRSCAILTAVEEPEEGEPPKDIKRLKEHFKGFQKPVEDILESLDPREMKTTNIGVVRTKKWREKRTIIIGDAANAMAPFTCLGSSMAMEDAYVLADELSKKEGSESLQKIFRRYKKRRIGRIRIYKELTRRRQRMLYSSLLQMPVVRNVVSSLFPVSYFTGGYRRLLDEEP